MTQTGVCVCTACVYLCMRASLPSRKAHGSRHAYYDENRARSVLLESTRGRVYAQLHGLPS